MCIFIDNTCYFLLSGFDPREQVLECLESCDQDVPPKLNASSGSNQKGHPEGGRGRGPLRKRSVKERLHTHTHAEDRLLKLLISGKVSFSNHFKVSECLSIHCKKPAFVLYTTPNGTRSIQYDENVPFCFFKRTHDVCSGICTTILTQQCHVFQTAFELATHLNKCTLFQSWLMSPTRESKKWFIVCCL